MAAVVMGIVVAAAINGARSPTPVSHTPGLLSPYGACMYSGDSRLTQPIPVAVAVVLAGLLAQSPVSTAQRSVSDGARALTGRGCSRVGVDGWAGGCPVAQIVAIER
jgi:hypothetical protein